MASYSNASNRRVKIISLIRVAIAVLLFVVGIAQFAAINFWASNTAVNLWTSVWIFVSGFLGYMSAVSGNGADSQSKSSKCYIDAFMAFSILSIFVVLGGAIVYCYAVIELSEYCHYNSNDFRGMNGMGECSAAHGLVSFSLALFLAEGLLCILSAILCCSALCCEPKENSPQVVVFPAGGGVVEMQGGMFIGQSGQVPQHYLAQQGL